jgi:tetratricopeptide (TPR) repeat protein
MTFKTAYFVMAFMFFNLLHAFPQQPRTGLLENSLNTSDTAKLRLLNEIAFQERQTNPEESFKAAQDAVSLALKTGNKKWLGISYKNLGTTYIYNGDDAMGLQNYRKALSIFEEIGLKTEIGIVSHNLAIAQSSTDLEAFWKNIQRALAVFEDINDKFNIAKVCRSIAIKYTEMSDYPKALEYYSRSFENFEAINDIRSMGTALNGIGICYMHLGKFPMSLKNYLKAATLFENVSDETNSAMAYNNAGIIYGKTGQFNKALEVLHKALEISRRQQERANISSSLTSIANVYHDMENLDSALSYHMQALQLDKEEGNMLNQANSLINIGIMYNEKKDYGKAIDYARQGVLLYQDTENKIGLTTALSLQADILLNAPEDILAGINIPVSERYNYGIKYLTSAINLSREIGALEKECFAWKNLSEIYEAKGDYKKSLEAYRQHTILHDSIYDGEKRDEITRMGMEYEFDKREAVAREEDARKQALAKAEIARQKYRTNLILLSSGFLLLAGTGSFILYKRNRDARQRQKEISATLRIKDTELKALRLQMNPHFIDNALQSIQYFMKEHKAEEAEEYLIKFSSLMRSVLTNSERDEIPLSKELETLEWYMQLENLRMNFPFSYTFHVDETVNVETTTVPPNILQPFVENSIKHGLFPKNAPGNIHIYIQQKENELHVIVEDDGVGRDNNKAIQKPAFFKRESLGIKITQERLNILNRFKNLNATFRIVDLTEDNLATGTRVELNLPYRP